MNAMSGLLLQLGLHPILLLLLDHPHHHWYDGLQQLYDYNDHDDQDNQVINTTMIRMIRPTLISRTQQSGYDQVMETLLRKHLEVASSASSLE